MKAKHQQIRLFDKEIDRKHTFAVNLHAAHQAKFDASVTQMHSLLCKLYVVLHSLTEVAPPKKNIDRNMRRSTTTNLPKFLLNGNMIGGWILVDLHRRSPLGTPGSRRRYSDMCERVNVELPRLSCEATTRPSYMR